MAADAVKYLVFDIESVADGELVSKVRFPGDELDSSQAIAKYRDELMETKNTDFIPYTYQIPAAIVVAKVAADFRLLDLVSLDPPAFRPHVMTDYFWRGWERYDCPTLVSFNGRTFDIPLLELAVFRYGLQVPRWFNLSARAYDQKRNRYNSDSHLDLYDVLTNFGASRFNGGLNLAAQLIGKPGKMEVQGHMVQDLFDEGKLAEIADYCCCDVLDTYFVFLRTQVMIGNLALEREQELVESTKEWLSAKSRDNVAYQAYLEQWGDWENPWREPAGLAASELLDPRD